MKARDVEGMTFGELCALDERVRARFAELRDELNLWTGQDSMRTNGPGKYDDECALVMGMTLARGVVLVVVGGEHGNGVSAKFDDPKIAAMMPAMLEGLAAQIRADLAAKHDPAA